MKEKLSQNEAVLACAARKGDKEAIKTLMMNNWQWLKGIVTSVIQNQNDIDDILQNICVTVIEKVHTLREPERFRSWLAVLSKRQALKYRMTKKRNLNILLSDEIAREVPDRHAEKDFENLELNEQYQQIMFEMNLLPEKYREALLLKYSKDLSYAQIAEILDVPVTTVQIRLVRARRMIHQRLVAKSHSN